MLGMVAALPRELQGLVRNAKPDPALLREGIHLYRLRGAWAVCAGMGGSRALLAVNAVRAAGASQLVSVGLAGACAPGLCAGAVQEIGCVVDILSGERFHTASNAEAVLATSDVLAGVQEKARLHATYGAALVDMEAATVARLARAHGLPFRAIKAVSDEHDFEITALSRFASAKGQFRTAAFAVHTALRPGRWRHAVRLGAGSQRALRQLTARLEQIRSEHE